MKLTYILEARLATPTSPLSSDTRIIRKIIRKAASDNGWGIWDARTDKTRTERRISVWGGSVSKRMKVDILNQIKRDMQKGNLPGKATWHRAMGWSGGYDKVVVKVPMEQDDASNQARKQDLKNELRRIQRKGLHDSESPEANRIQEIRRILRQNTRGRELPRRYQN